MRQTCAADATFEALPNQTRVCHTRLTVEAPNEDAAVALATRISEAMQRAFVCDSGGELLANVRRRATPVADSTTETVGQALRIGAAVLAILGVVLIALGVMRLQAGADRLPAPIWWGIGFSIAIPLAVTLLPGAVVMALFFMAIPGFIAGLILWKVSELRHAANWPSTKAKINKSEMRAEHHRHSGKVTQVKNLTYVEYEFTLGDRVIKGTRIGIGEIPDDPSDTRPLSRRHYGAGLLRSEEPRERPA